MKKNFAILGVLLAALSCAHEPNQTIIKNVYNCRANNYVS